MALFGLQYILFVFFPDDVSNLVFQIKTFAELALASTQVNESSLIELSIMTNTAAIIDLMSFSVLLFSLRVLWWLSATFS